MTRAPLAAVALGLVVGAGAAGCALVRDGVSLSHHFTTWTNAIDAERMVPPPPLEAVCARGTMNYIVPTDTGVVVIDAGYDEDATTLRAAIGDREVLAVLLTHAHVDHRLAAHQFDAPVYVGRRDLDWLEGEPTYKNPLISSARTVMGLPPLPVDVRTVDDGDVLEIDGARFSVVALPGHTPGSVGYHHGAVLFSGDAIASPDGESMYPAPFITSEDIGAAWRSFRRVRELEFDVVLDGHFGRTDDARPKIRAAIDRVRARGIYDYPLFTPRGCFGPE